MDNMIIVIVLVMLAIAIFKKLKEQQSRNLEELTDLIQELKNEIHMNKIKKKDF